MKIGIIVAMEKELKLLLPLIEDCASTTLDDTLYYKGHVGEHEVVATLCGIGKVNAALRADALIRTFNPDMVINTGVAGGTGGGAGILDVVVGDRVAYHDVWCGPGTEWGQAAGCPRFFTSAQRAVELDCLNESQNVKHGLVCSGDIFVADAEVVDKIKSRFPDVLAVDMESAAIAQTCYRYGTEFLCLRVLSDTPGDCDNNIAQYESFWDDAPRRTFDIITQVLASLK